MRAYLETSVNSVFLNFDIFLLKFIIIYIFISCVNIKNNFFKKNIILIHF
jgi:hypothetical protein